MAGYLFKAQKPFVIFGAIYASIVVLLALSTSLQRQLLYLHSIRWPLGAEFDLPEKYGMAPGKTLAFKIPTPSEQTLGAWLTVADSFYRDHGPENSTTNYHLALQEFSTILFFHGNAASRAVGFRVWFQRAYSLSLGCNVLTVDYRGFGDSTGSPTEEGLLEDALASWNWLLSNGASQTNIVIAGHSLGTAVSAKLAVTLKSLDQTPRAVVLFAPFTSVPKLLETYMFGGFIPFLAPLMTIPLAPNLLRKSVVDKWDTKSIINQINAPILLFHAKNDYEILSSHSSELFLSLLEPLLPSLDLSMAAKDLEARRTYEQKKVELVQKSVISGLGTVQQFYRNGFKVIFMETEWGGHDAIAGYEGVLNSLKDELRL